MDIQDQNDFIRLDDSSEEADSVVLAEVQEEEPAEYLSIDTLTPLPIPPWVAPDRSYSRNFITMLDEEILDFVAYVKPTRAERTMRQFTLKRLRQVLAKTWPTAVLNCFGSFETELYLPSSDLDCVVMESNARVPGCLYVLHDKMVQAGIASRIDVIATSKVPIIKYVDSLTHINVDVSFNMTNGIETAKIVKNFVQDRHIGEAVRHLMLLLKQFLVQRHFNEVFTGGLGSYALLCMITSFLRVRSVHVDSSNGC
jgi:non-canonical poly(A) RNA polymerase PAPD5/7